MIPKPHHLGPEYAAQFADPSVVRAYHHRPPYPPDLFPILAGLLPEGRRAVLDAGCGTGDLARPLARIVGRVDAVDVSPAMIEEGKRLPGGDAPNLSWIPGSVEDAPLHPPYGLVTAGESLHWMDWDRVLPRFRRLLAPGCCVAILEREELPSPWRAGLLQLITTYSTNREYQPYDLVEELERRELFEKRGEHRATPMPFTQTVESYIESIHSRNGFSRDRMREHEAAAFDARARDLVSSYSRGGMLQFHVVGVMVWGSPGPRE